MSPVLSRIPTQEFQPNACAFSLRNVLSAYSNGKMNQKLPGLEENPGSF